MPARLLLYNTVLLILGILTLPWVIYQLFFVKKRRQGLAQRLGRPPVMEKKTVWCHAVSVGEVRAISPMLSLLQADERTSDRVVLSTVTLTGHETAKRECGFVKSFFYFPLDFPFVAARAIERVNPEIFVTAETEIWPNFFAACFKRDIPVIVVNGRISDSSYSRYIRFRWFFRPILRRVSLFLMQSEEDARRIVEMGAGSETVKITGNMKYDRVPDSVSLPEGIENWAEGGFLLVAGSTHAGEEEIILRSIKEMGEEQILLALVPRHPERFNEVAKLLDEESILFTRYSELLKGHAIEGDVILVDAMGVLDGFYALADVAFVGGSLVPVGGHNLLEPAMHGVPVLTGPYFHNFNEIADSLLSSGGSVIVKDGQVLQETLRDLLNNKGKRDIMGEAAFRLSSNECGASERNTTAILKKLEERIEKT